MRAMGEKEELAFAERSKFFKKEAKTKGRNAGQDFNVRLSKRGHAGDLSGLDALLRTRAPEELSAETLGELLDGLRGAVSNL